MIKKSNIKKIKKWKNKNLIIHIIDLKCVVDVNEDVYTYEDYKYINHIIKRMSKNIWIDRTYVDFKGNRWKDAFIAETAWDEFCSLVINSDMGKKCSKQKNEEISYILTIFAMTYLYSLLQNMGFEIENISISLKKRSKFKVKYEIDNRKTWNS